MKKLFLLVLFGLLVAACGGGDADDGPEESPDTTSGATNTTQAVSSDDTQPAPTTTAAAADEGSSDVEGVGMGSATIAGETYEFGDNGQPGLQCLPDAFGVAFLAALVAVDGSGGNIVVGIPFPGSEETAGIMPELEVSAGDLTWQANAERAAERGIPEGSSQVDSYEINGNTITGTATFYEENSSFGGNLDDLIVETGTFEVTCAG